MGKTIQDQEANGGLNQGGTKPPANNTSVKSAFPQATPDFSVKGMGNESANGGTVNTNHKSSLMSYTEYSRKKGSDGFSKNGGRR